MTVIMNKLYLIFAVVLSVTVFVTAKRIKNSWIEQKLDHFNNSDKRTWPMRYIANGEFYQEGGPLFIFVGGEWPISRALIGPGLQIYHMAREHHGYLFYTEHRFYGSSRPLANMTNENLKYLETRQALADLAHFIRSMKETHDGMENSKVILVGCSYAGALVTWLKKLYPDLATGVWASSATLLAKTDFAEGKDLTAQAIKKVGGDACYNRIKNGISALETMLANKRAADVKVLLRLCETFNGNNEKDVSTLFSEISELIISYVNHRRPVHIRRFCSQVMEGSSDVIGLANFLSDKLGIGNCTTVSYNKNLKYFRNSEFGEGLLRQRIYQQCNEFGWFQTSGSPNQTFGAQLPLDYYITLCADIYGDKFNREYIEERVQITNERFGGLHPDVENVYWTYGELDSWRAVGMPNGTHVTIIPNLSHCGDLYAVKRKDSPEMKASKEKLDGLVRQWLAE